MIMKYFKESDYVAVHNYALRYKDGDEESAEKLIECFNLFIYKYANFLAYGVCDINNYSLRSFVSLYIDDKRYRKALPSYMHKPFVKYQFGIYATNTSALFKKYTFDELYNECICVLLSMAKRYKDSRPSFHNYVFKCFHYELERSLKKLIKDPLSKMDIPYDTQFVHAQNISVQNIYDYSYEALLDDINKEVQLKNSETISVKDESTVYDLESLNINWINGITCSEEFKELTPFEREILVSNYISKKTDSQIADELGLCRATVNRKKSQAKKALYKKLKKEHKIK